MRDYVLGVDGGGTKTDYMLFDTQGNCAGYLRGSGSNHENISGGMTGLEVLLRDELLSFLRKHNTTPEQISGAAFGMAGVDVPAQKATVESIVERLGFPNFRVMNDSFLGIKSGCQNGYGVCVVIGTGNTVSGIDRNGRWLQVAGTGYISCEDGGAGRMAEHVLRAVYSEQLCLGPTTAMTPAVKRMLGVDDPALFMQALYEKYRTGMLTPKDILDVLFDCANQADEVAWGILAQVGLQNARCIAGCASRLDFGDEFDVVIAGSVALKASCPVLMNEMKRETVLLTGKSIRFISLDVPPVAGAILWAVELAQGRPAEKIVAQKIKAGILAPAED